MMQFVVRKDGWPLASFDAASFEAARERFLREFADRNVVLVRVDGHVAFFESASSNQYQVYPKQMDVNDAN